MAGLENDAALAALGLALAVGFFETTQELLRARLQAFTVMKATMVRATLVPALASPSPLSARPASCFWSRPPSPTWSQHSPSLAIPVGDSPSL